MQCIYLKDPKHPDHLDPLSGARTDFDKSLENSMDCPDTTHCFYYASNVCLASSRFIEERVKINREDEEEWELTHLPIPKHYQGLYQPGLFDVCGPPLKYFMPWATAGCFVASILVPVLAVASSHCEGKHEMLATYPYWLWLPFFLWVAIMVLLDPRLSLLFLYEPAPPPCVKLPWITRVATKVASSTLRNARTGTSQFLSDKRPQTRSGSALPTLSFQ